MSTRTSTPTSRPRTITRLAALLVGVVTVGMIGLPAAHATDLSASLVLAPGQSGPIGTVASNTDVTPVPTCDPGLSVSFDATMAGTVHVAPDAALGSYACSVDFQISGQSIGLIEQVSVQVVPGLSIADVTGQEGSTGQFHPSNAGGTGLDPIDPIQPVPVNFAAFTVTMSVPSPSAVTVAVTTADGTATAPSDYGSVNTTVTFQPGQTIALVGVPIVVDDTEELDESFSVNLSGATGAVIVDGQGMCTILNDDHTLGT